MELIDKVAIITGAASGIGESTAKLFAKEGAKLVLTDVDVEKGEELVKAIKADGGEAIFVKVDVSRPEASEQTVNLVLEKFGKLNVAVNNAGIGGASAPVGNMNLMNGIR